jgi:hypothetical protein
MLLAISLSLPDSSSFPRLLELLLNRFRDLCNEKVSVRTICERDDAFSTYPPTRLICAGSGTARSRCQTVLPLDEQIVLKIACGCL